MKSNRLPFWIGLLSLAAGFAPRLDAQTFSVVHSFVYPAESPYAPLVAGPDGMLYGTTSQGGNGDYGTVFKVKPNGTGYTNLVNFYSFSDGANPSGGLVLTNGMLYGTTTAGGDGGNGTVFAVTTNGTGFTVLWTFSEGATNLQGNLTNADGADPEAGLVLSGGMLFGTTYSGGIGGNGTVFALGTNGASFTVLKSFSAGGYNGSGVYINADGANPEAGLLLLGTNLYGAAYGGGLAGSGTLFRLSTNGGTFNVVKTFSATNTTTGANPDGANPYAGLVAAGTTLYGVAENGGNSGYGVVFALAPGGNYSVLKNFSAPDPNTGTNLDGANPDGTLVLSGTNLIGTAYDGGTGGNGAVFLLTTNGGGFTNLYSFKTGNDAANPVAGLALAGGVLYGTANTGGNWDTGTLFSLNTNGTSFTNFYIFAGADGVEPLGGALVSGGMTYGLTYSGGANNNGMVYRMNTNGTGFTILKSFSAIDPNTGTNADGANPQGNLLLLGTNLFGTATAGGNGGSGTLFAVGTNGGFRVLWNFSAGADNGLGGLTNADGIDPEAGLTLAGSNLFGTTAFGGVWGNGVIFMLNTNGTGFTPLRSFSIGGTNVFGLLTNADGADTEAGLTLCGTNLFGTTYQGGTNGNGTIFRIGTNGGSYTIMKTFSAADPNTGTNFDGANPHAALVWSGTNLFGTTENGGYGGNGTVFALGTNGAGYAVLWNFSTTDAIEGTNLDGANPDGALVLTGSTLYGSTSAGGLWAGGSLFEINTNGGNFANLHYFNFISDGDSNLADLALAGNVLWGTTSEGGVSGGGTVFNLNTAVTSPPLAISLAGTNVNLSWPYPSVGFTLQQNTNLVATNWLTYPGTVGNNGLTNTAVSARPSRTLFFRLYHP